MFGRNLHARKKKKKEVKKAPLKQRLRLCGGSVVCELHLKIWQSNVIRKRRKKPQTY